MTNWSDPAREYAVMSPFFSMTSWGCSGLACDSCSHQVCKCDGWPVHVSHRLRFLSASLFQLRTSWEFVVNLDYEYSVITGKRKFILSYLVSSSYRSGSSRMDDFIQQSTSFSWDVVGARYSPSYYSS